LHYDTQDSIKQNVSKTTFNPEHFHMQNDDAVWVFLLVSIAGLTEVK